MVFLDLAVTLSLAGARDDRHPVINRHKGDRREKFATRLFLVANGNDAKFMFK